MPPPKQSRYRVLISHIVGHVVNPEEAAVLYQDEGFWGEVEALAVSDSDK